MRVLLTGHLGYLGTVMEPALRAAGHEVVGLDTGYFADCVLGPVPEAGPETRIDLRDVTPATVAGFDAVVHLAALSNDPLGDLDPELTADINVGGTMRLARLARDAGVRRFLFASSCSLYGSAGGDELVGEDAPLRPITPYARAKVAVEDGLRELADRDFSPVSLRNATAYGWSPRLRLDLVLNDFVGSAVGTGKVVVRSDGMAWRPVMHAVDIAVAFLAVLEAPRDAIHGEAFNVGTNAENCSVRELATAVADVGECEVVTRDETGSDPRSYKVDFSKLAATLPAFVPTFDIRAGVRDLFERFAAFGLEPAARGRFVRLTRLQELQGAGRLDSTLRWRDP